MQMKVLAVGDVVASAGLKYLKANLRKLKQEKEIDFCIVNGENAAVLGLLPSQAEEILDAGADVITMGNPILRRRARCCVLRICPRSSRGAAGVYTKHGLVRLQ